MSITAPRFCSSVSRASMACVPGGLAWVASFLSPLFRGAARRVFALVCWGERRASVLHHEEAKTLLL